MVIDFVRNNSKDILLLLQTERQHGFQCFAMNRKQKDLFEKLCGYREQYGQSPEDILVSRENNKQIILLIKTLRDKLGERCVCMLFDRYAYNKKVKDIAVKYGFTRPHTSIILKKGLRDALKIVNKLQQQGRLDEDIFKKPHGIYVARSPSVKVRYPVDSAKETYDRSYIYGGRLKHKTKCMIPEYLNGCFGDTSTVCSLCANSIGEPTCNRYVHRKDKDQLGSQKIH